MWNIKNYKPGFDPWGLALFLVIMLPNFLWFALPAPDDVLRIESVTPLVDTIAQGFQVIMAAALCAIINTTRSKPVNGDLAGGAVCTALYFTGWAAYYAGIANPAVILDLCLAPCGAFLFFALARKNAFALISAGAFTICHFVFAMVNFIL